MTINKLEIGNPLDAEGGMGNPFFLYHRGGPWLRAVFSSASDALVWEEGNRGRRYAEMFFITDEHGKKVTFQENVHGHAEAILATLRRTSREGEGS